MANVVDLLKARQTKQIATEGKSGETLSVSPEKSDHLYISKCNSCTFTVETIAAKCLVEKSDDTTVKFTERLIAGTLELYKCNNVSVYVSPKDMLPSVVIDQCSNIDLYFHQPTLLHKIYTIACKNIVIHFEPPYKKEQALEFPHELEDNEQCITSHHQGKLLTEKMLRAGGGYPSTAKEEKLAEQREKLMEQHVEKMLQGMLSRPRDRAQAVEKPAEKRADKPVEKPADQ